MKLLDLNIPGLESMDSGSRAQAVQSRIISALQEAEKLLLKLPELESRVNSLSKEQNTLLSQISAINKALEVSVKAITLLNEVKKVEVPKSKSWLANLLNLRKK